MNRLIIGSLFIMSLSANAQTNHTKFKAFIDELKVTEQADKVKAVFSKSYIKGAKFMRYSPEVDEKEVLTDYTSWFLNSRIKNSRVIRYGSESFNIKDDIYVWTREAEYKGAEGRLQTINLEFVLQDGRFVIPDHFSFPSLEQLSNLEKMQNVYSLYFVMDNVANYELYINDHHRKVVNKKVTSTQLFDIKVGSNKLIFTFEKEDESRPVSFAASIVYADRKDKKRKVDGNEPIHLVGQALSLDSWDDLVLSKEHLVLVNEDKVLISVDLK